MTCVKLEKNQKNECQKESARLLVLRDQTRVAAQKLVYKKKNLLVKNISYHIIMNPF